MSRTPLMLGISVALLAAGGCATVPKDSGFGDVKRDVEGRTGVKVRWDRGSAPDHEVTEAVRAMLADGLTADEAVQVALLNNRRLQATYEGLGVAQAEVVQAGLLHNPVFDADAKFLEAAAARSS